jgi:hypothetical protein
MDMSVGEKADRIGKKFDVIVVKNTGIETVAQICQILSGSNFNHF